MWAGGIADLEDGRVLEVANVVWSTGFHHDLSWIDLPGMDDREPATGVASSTASPACT